MSATAPISTTTPKPTSTTSKIASIILSMEEYAKVIDIAQTAFDNLETLNKTLGALQAPSIEQLSAQTEVYMTERRSSISSFVSISTIDFKLRYAITTIELPLSHLQLEQFQYLGKESVFNDWIIEAKSKEDVSNMTQTLKKTQELRRRFNVQLEQATKTLGQLCYNQLKAHDPHIANYRFKDDIQLIRFYRRWDCDTRPTTNKPTPPPTSTASQAPAPSKTQSSTTPSATPATAPLTCPQPTTTTVTPVIAATTVSSLRGRRHCGCSMSATTQPPATTETTTSQVSTSTTTSTATVKSAATTNETDAFPTKTQDKRVMNAPSTASTSNSERSAEGISMHREAIQEFIRKMNSHSIQPSALSESLDFYRTTARAIQEMTGQLNELGGAIANAWGNTKT